MQWVIVPENENIPKYQSHKIGTASNNPEIINALEKLNNILLGKRQ
jgi:hypothetical protein